MTSRLERRLLLALVGLALGAGLAAGWTLRDRQCRSAQLERALAEESARRALAERRAAAARKALRALAAQKEKPPALKAAWKEKKSGKRLVRPPADCRACLAAVKREVVVKDRDRGWWTYRDPDVLDDQPGTLTLNPRFFLEAGTMSQASAGAGPEEGQPPRSLPPRPDKTRFLGPPVMSLRLAAGLESYEAELGYDPVALRLGRTEVLLGVRARASLARGDALLRGGLSAGLELRWR